MSIALKLFTLDAISNVNMIINIILFVCWLVAVVAVVASFGAIFMSLNVLNMRAENRWRIWD